MARIYLTKEFSEFDGLELAIVHWTAGPRGSEPDWSRRKSLALQAFKQDHRWVRRGVLDIDLEGDGPWTLHHFFEWMRYGVSQTGPAYDEDLVAHQVDFEESSGEFSDALLVFNLGEDGWTNVVPMALDGAPGGAIASPEWPELPGTSRAARARRRAAAGLRPPLKFSGRVVGPAGARVIYSIHLARKQGLNPMADTGHWVMRSELVL